MDYKLVLDIIVSILLAATIGYAVLLNSRLVQLRKNRDDLARLVGAFNDATVRAESGIPKLKRATEEAEVGLQERVEKAQSLRDDLAFMIERADTMVNRLETAVRSARDVKLPSPPPVPPSSASSASSQSGVTVKRPVPAQPEPPNEFDDDRSEAERELLRALRAVR